MKLLPLLLLLLASLHASALRVTTLAIARPTPALIHSRRHACCAATAAPPASDREEVDLHAPLFTPVAGAVMGRTENGAPTFVASGRACLDLYFDSVPGIDEERLKELLGRAWAEDATTTLRLIFQLGDPRKGKSDKRNFYRSMMWLWQHHPESFLRNLPFIPRHCYYKALLDLLQARARGLSLVLDDQRERSPPWNKDKARKKTHESQVQDYLASRGASSEELFQEELRVKRARPHYWRTQQWATEESRAGFIKYILDRQQKESQIARKRRKERRAQLKADARALYGSDPSFQRMFDATADIFADALRAEQAQLDAGELISGLPAKWAPTPRGAHDRDTRIVDGIVERLYPAEENKADGVSHEEYLSYMRKRYQKLLSAQRAAAEVPEHFTGTGEWHLVNYERMASKCRLMFGQSTFRKHDEARYDQFLEECEKEALKPPEERTKKGKRVSAGVLLPHKLVERAKSLSPNVKRPRPQDLPAGTWWASSANARMDGDMLYASLQDQYGIYRQASIRVGPGDEFANDNGAFLLTGTSGSVEQPLAQQKEDPPIPSAVSEVNLQWLRLVEDTKASGKLPSALAVCDVSGSMSGEPMEVAVALSLLLSDVAEEPWRNRICTFSRAPKFVTVPSATTDNLAERAYDVERLQWDMNTDFQLVFDELLSFAQRNDLKADDMLKTIFVFSDMEFDQCKCRPYSTDLEIIQDKYKNAGYPVPELIFWNLRASSSRPATYSEPGVTFLSGFSAGMMKSFLEYRLDSFTPQAQMLAALTQYGDVRVAAADLPAGQQSEDAADGEADVDGDAGAGATQEEL